MSLLVISPTLETNLTQYSFRPIETKSWFQNQQIVISAFQLEEIGIVIDTNSYSILHSRPGRYALIGSQEEKQRPFSVFWIPNFLSLDQVELYLKSNIEVVLVYPLNTYYLSKKDIKRLTKLENFIQSNPTVKKIELIEGEKELIFCLLGSPTISFSIENEESMNNITLLMDSFSVWDCQERKNVIIQIAKEIILQLRTHYAKRVSNFFHRHAQKLNQENWSILSANPNTSVQFWEKHKQHIDWRQLSKNYSIPVSFFQQALDKVDWLLLAENPNIPDRFFRQYLDPDDWQWLKKKEPPKLSASSNLSLSILHSCLDDLDWSVLSANPNVPVEFFRQHLDKIDWTALSANPSIPVDFFQEEKNLDKVDWTTLSANPGIPVWFFRQHLDCVNWTALSSNPGISLDFLLSLDQINWTALSANPGIPLDFLAQNLNRVDLSSLCSNIFLFDNYALRKILKSFHYFPSFLQEWKEEALRFLK